MSEHEPFDVDETGELIRAVQSGDELAREKLFERYLPFVQQLVALRLGWKLSQIVEIDDIVQDCFLRALQTIDSFEHRSDGSFRNWLAKCVERAIIDTHRRENCLKRGGGKVRRFGDCEGSVLHSSIFGGDVSTPSAHARAGELADKLEDALLELPTYQRELILLRTLCYMSFEEIAEQLGTSNEAAVRVACSRALRELKARVE